MPWNRIHEPSPPPRADSRRSLFGGLRVLGQQARDERLAEETIAAFQIVLIREQ